MSDEINLIVEADEPALFYRDVDYAEIDLEHYDLRDGTYTALFGPSGEPYRIWTEDDRVRIEPVVGEPPGFR